MKKKKTILCILSLLFYLLWFVVDLLKPWETIWYIFTIISIPFFLYTINCDFKNKKKKVLSIIKSVWYFLVVAIFVLVKPSEIICHVITLVTTLVFIWLRDKEET